MQNTDGFYITTALCSGAWPAIFPHQQQSSYTYKQNMNNVERGPEGCLQAQGTIKTNSGAGSLQKRPSTANGLLLVFFL